MHAIDHWAAIHSEFVVACRKRTRELLLLNVNPEPSSDNFSIVCVCICVSIRAMGGSVEAFKLRSCPPLPELQKWAALPVPLQTPDNRPFCVWEAGGVYFLDVGLILFIYLFYQAKAQTEGWPLSLRSITLLTNNRLSGAVERQGGLYSCICVLIVLLIQQIVSWTICLYCKSIRGKAKAYICEHTNHRQLQQTGIKSI